MNEILTRMHPGRIGKLRLVESICLVLVVLLVLLTGSVLAQNGESYELTWWTVDGGGSIYNQGGEYSFGGTIGQPDAGTLSGGEYTLAGGFWNSTSLDSKRIVYLPLINKNH